MKLIMRADDFGYTEEFNRGTIEAVRNGIITTVDLMLDTPGTLDAMERIKEFPWVSVGWHGGHCWGRPVADPDELLKEEIVITAWHPGYLDDVIFNMFPKNHFHTARVIDIAAMCSPALKQWVVDKQVELINMRDALLGTREYQNHLRAVGSSLYIKKER